VRCIEPLKRTAAKGLSVNLQDMIEFAKDGIVSKTLVKTIGQEVSLFCMSTGQTISMHRSDYPAIIHVLQGEGEVALADQKYEAKSNSWFYMPADLPHAIQATDNLVFLLTIFKQTERK